MNTTMLGLLSVGLLSGALTAQRLIAYDPLAGLATELQPPTALLPVPNPPLVTYPVAPPLPPGVPGFPAPGDATFDNVIGALWYTDGTILAAMPSPAYPPLGPLPGPLPIPAAVMGAIGGPPTGIALDPVAGVMYLTSIPGFTVGVALVPGLPIVVPPFPPAFPMPPVAGLEWDGITGTLWYVDVMGTAYNAFVGGVPIGAPVPPAVPMPPPAGDIAIDKIGTINAAGARPLYVGFGPMVVDIADPTAIPFPSGPPTEGLAFFDHPAEVPVLPGCEGCPGMTAGPTAFTTSVMSNANPGFTVGMGGLIPGFSFGLFAFDSTPAPLFPINGPLACPLGLPVGPTTILYLGGPADAAGNIFLPVGLFGLPIGLSLNNQNATLCTSQPSGFALSRLQTITVGGL